MGPFKDVLENIPTQVQCSPVYGVPRASLRPEDVQEEASVRRLPEGLQNTGQLGATVPQHALRGLVGGRPAKSSVSQISSFI